MGFPDMLTLMWAKNKYGGDGSPGSATSGIPLDVTETIAEYRHGNEYPELNGFFKISDCIPNENQLNRALCFFEMDDADGHFCFAYPVFVTISREDVIQAETIELHFYSFGESVGENAGLYISFDPSLFEESGIKTIWLAWAEDFGVMSLPRTFAEVATDG